MCRSQPPPSPSHTPTPPIPPLFAPPHPTNPQAPSLESLSKEKSKLEKHELLSQATAFINRRPLVVLGAADKLGHLIPWYLDGHNMSVTNSQRPDDTLLNYHPLTTRAVELQTRLEVFKRDINLFYARALCSYGKLRNDSTTPSVGSEIYIFDKASPKVNFLQRFALGRTTKYLRDNTAPW